MAKNILVVDTHQSGYVLRQLLTREGHHVCEVHTLQETSRIVEEQDFDLALVDIDLPDEAGFTGLDVLRMLRSSQTFPVILITDRGHLDVLHEAVLRLGSYEYIVKPIVREQVLPLIRSTLDRSQIQRQIAVARRQAGEKFGLTNLIATSHVMQPVKALIRQVADHDSSVMILGESGTGKEMVARAIHMESMRRKGPFVAINCGAIPADLVEAELFGYERGSFTGATASREGKFEQANTGTLFLDEIGEMPLATQVKLLRVLEERKVTRIGSRHEITVDFRLLCATNADIAADVVSGAFRQDLYYRVNVITIPVPPLRERGEDIVLLAELFIRDFSGHMVRLSEPTRQALRALPWRGNVRELRNAIERATILAGPRHEEIDRHLLAHTSSITTDLASPTHATSSGSHPRVLTPPAPLPGLVGVEERLDALIGELLDAREDAPEDSPSLLSYVEDRIIAAAFERCGQNKARAARLVGIERKAFERRVSRLQS